MSRIRKIILAGVAFLLALALCACAAPTAQSTPAAGSAPLSASVEKTQTPEASEEPSASKAEPATEEPSPSKSVTVAPSAQIPSSSPAAASATPAPTQTEETDDGTSSLRTPDPSYETVHVTGSIVDVDEEQKAYTVREPLTGEAAAEASVPDGEVIAVETEDCMILDAQTGEEVDDSELHVGQTVRVYVSKDMSQVLPARAECYAIMTDLPVSQEETSAATYVTPIEISTAEDGVSILNQNASLRIEIPNDLPIEVFGGRRGDDEDEEDEPRTADVKQVHLGTPLIVWYDWVDMVLQSRYPAVVTAQRVLLDLRESPSRH